ncbi:MAG: hypothetical protein FJ284_03530 [Planctomycetes bacterium]|nr:hypothetical protein [Planctomycetota bacterium]
MQSTGYTSLSSLTLNNQSGTAAYTGAIANGAWNMSLVKAGAGTQALAGANTYTGPTLISAGTLQLGAGGAGESLSPSSAITDNARLAFNRTNTLTQGIDFASVIAGSGDVAQVGSGTTIPNGVNAYFGQTVVGAGTLTVGPTGLILFSSGVGIGAGTFAYNSATPTRPPRPAPATTRW